MARQTHTALAALGTKKNAYTANAADEIKFGVVRY